MSHFTLLSTSPTTRARRGRVQTAHGVIETPAFMPVGTQGAVKSVHPSELEQLETQIILGNTYHLFLRPGLDLMRAAGGLHTFSRWNRPILTDSGGFQVFSLAKLRKITEEGVRFQSHIDGSPYFIGPETSMEIQSVLGSDIAMAFDECPPYPCERAYAERSLELTLRWARRCRAWIEEHKPQAGGGRGRQLHFGIVQGSVYADLRERSARALVEMGGWDGYAIGGVSVGEPEEEMMRAVEHSAPFLPADCPRYAMGLGTPPQMLAMIARGVDMFDCVLPTRLARHGTLFTRDGPVHIRNAKFERDFSPLDADTHALCEGFSRSYVRHLFKSGEILGLRLISLHNLYFYLSLMSRARKALEAGNYDDFHRDFTDRYLFKHHKT